MNKYEAKTCCLYGISVNLLISRIGVLIDHYVGNEKELIDKDLFNILQAIEMIRKDEKNYKKAIGIEVEE